MRVLVAMPLIGRDATQVIDWRGAIDRVAASAPHAEFETCAAVRESDGAAAAACALAGVRAALVPDYDLEAGRRHNYEGLIAKRRRLVEEAERAGADAVWFVDADVRPRPEDWAALEAALQRGAVALIPYAVRWAGGAPLVCLFDGPGQLALADARRVVSREGDASVVVAGGGMGCTAFLLEAAAGVDFEVAEFPLRGAPEGGYAAGEDLGWFKNAALRGLAVRMPVGRVVAHVGCRLAAPSARGRGGR